VVVGEITTNVDLGESWKLGGPGRFICDCFGPISLLIDDWLVARLAAAKLVRLPIRYDVAGAVRSKLSELRGRDHEMMRL
jgi:hypothetical protein